jgi:hypothetical protein
MHYALHSNLIAPVFSTSQSFAIPLEAENASAQFFGRECLTNIFVCETYVSKHLQTALFSQHLPLVPDGIMQNAS